MTRFRLITTWLLLLIPTLLLGVGAIYLLKGEEDRLRNAARATANDRIVAIAGNIDLAIAEVKDGLMENLMRLPPTDLDQQADLLEEWKRSNPLVRNVFIWERGRGLRFPDPEMPASDEEADFIRRYLSLFANQAAWQEPPPDTPPTAGTEQISSILLERKELRELAKQAPQVAAKPPASRYSSAPAAPATLTAEMVAEPGIAADQAGAADQNASKVGLLPRQGDWRHWFADNQLHLIGWCGWEGRPQRVGIEVEMMALLSRLLGNFPVAPPDGETYALIDGNSNIFHQAGPVEITPAQKPLASTVIGGLPHWQIAAYSNPDSGASSSAFTLIAALLVGTFVVAILFGGSMLLWQAHRNQVDAHQKTSFVSNVSHELKTPLTTIRMYAEMLGEKRVETEEKQQSYLQTIIRESQRLTRLVNNVLDFSRLEQGRREFAHEQIDLADLLHQLLDDQLMRIEEAGIRLTRSIPEHAVLIESDRDALEQIILNLIDNGIKYAADGKTLSLILNRTVHGCSIRIADNGPGIPSAHRQQIFQKFHRIDASLTTRQQGSGLGLSIARQLAEGLGGTLSFCPNEPGGSCFELFLPTRKLT